MSSTRRIVLAVTGASGMEYARSLARALRSAPGVELHGIVSDAARQVFRHELGADPAELDAFFHVIHEPENIAAGPLLHGQPGRHRHWRGHEPHPPRR